MKTITFSSHHLGTKLNIRLSDDKFIQLTKNKYYQPFELYIKDCDRVNEGYEPEIFSIGQINKLNSFLSCSGDTWKTIEIK